MINEAFFLRAEGVATAGDLGTGVRAGPTQLIWRLTLPGYRRTSTSKRPLRQETGEVSYAGDSFLLKCPVSDAQWLRVRHLFQPVKGSRWGRPARDPRMILDAILWVTVNDERWHHLPASFGPPQTAYIKWLQWKRSGLMEKVLEILAAEIAPG